jgi:hypothetical protein
VDAARPHTVRGAAAGDLGRAKTRGCKKGRLTTAPANLRYLVQARVASVWSLEDNGNVLRTCRPRASGDDHRATPRHPALRLATALTSRPVTIAGVPVARRTVAISVSGISHTRLYPAAMGASP